MSKDGAIDAAQHIAVSKEEWKRAKEIQKQKGEQSPNFKLRRKDQENQIEHSFMSVLDPQTQQMKLYALSNNGQILGEGEFGKTKLAVDEEGNYVAIKIQASVEYKPNVVQATESEDELQDIESEEELEADDYAAAEKDDDVSTEKMVEGLLNRDKGGFDALSPSRKPRKREPGGDKIDLEFDQVTRKTYQVMEYLGVSLKEVLNKGNLSDKQKKEIGIGLLVALKELQDKNIIHLDLHPGNILVDMKKDPIKVSIIDFGKANILKNKEAKVLIGKGEHGMVITLPPEIIRWKKDGKAAKKNDASVSLASDIYSVGLLLGQRPEQVKSEADHILGAPLMQNDPALQKIDMVNPDPSKRPNINTVLYHIAPEKLSAEERSQVEIEQSLSHSLTTSQEPTNRPALVASSFRKHKEQKLQQSSEREKSGPLKPVTPKPERP